MVHDSITSTRLRYLDVSYSHIDTSTISPGGQSCSYMIELKGLGGTIEITADKLLSQVGVDF